MTYVITHGCCGDGSCIPVCPVQCIRPRPGDPDFTSTEQLYIDPATCIDCGACMDECPVNAIHSEWDLPDELGEYLAVNAAHFAQNPVEESSPVKQPRRVLPTENPELRVAIIGTGPAGCYAASALTDIKGVGVTMFERLPTPFGLVRAGVAPDHAGTKQISKRFGAVLARPSVTCYFNVEVGRDITVDEILEHHHAVIWAVGAGDDRGLGVPGEDLAGSVSAREFVGWYNGHPDFADRDFDFSGKRAVIIGNGNVALDAARILARPVDALASTDIADHALARLATSQISDVVVTARRGPEHAAFTSGELSGLVHTEDIAVRTVGEELTGLDGTDRASRILLEAAGQAGSDNRSITFRFGLTPEAFKGLGHVESVIFRRPDGTRETMEATLVIRAIGHRGREVAGLPFDEARGTVVNDGGRIIDPGTGDAVVGNYCTGWFKRGATGMIGTNKADSEETVETLLSDFTAGALQDPTGDADVLDKLVRERQPDVVGKDAWARIDQAERARGRQARRPRQKFISVTEMLEAGRAAG
ncbi:FAD-dependent oxidoreductase [Streptomyces sp. SID8361]|uniref:FAD-dependent oxidoreductase n=1 Tax=Streptomyces sp. MnatMP-M27 TaxID=1839768 RepID=UPI00081EEE1D|nr:FAD-dependent oxidoreductase [Streptomyces sp. MnatMP-M27]MYU11083.1 FAD-dependent oxidoreductase [Streptomyces sp. SID8361]SCF78139.1 ferredoxin--NADP+ reductase [Streptomyces sp. MnatMP-M27]